MPRLRHPLLAALPVLTLALLAAAPRAAAWETVSPSADDVLWLERDSAVKTGVFAATPDGLHHSTDAGDTWRLLDERAFVRLASSPADPARLYAIERRDTFVFTVYRSDDGGERFAEVSTLLGGGFGGGLLELEVSPGDADVLYVSITTRPRELSFSSQTDVHRSIDGGRTWSSIRWFPADVAEGGKTVGDLEVAATDGDRIYAASDGIDRSDDGGDSWQTVRAGGHRRVEVDPLDEDHVLAVAGDHGLWETHDGGATWSRIDGELPGAIADGDVFFDPIDRSVLYVVASGAVGSARVFATRDGGDTWEPVDAPLPPPVRHLAITPTSPRHLLALADLGIDGVIERTAFDLPLCPQRPTALCLDDGRFLVEVAWEDFQGGRGTGFGAPLTADAGTFWFFEPDNLELAVKVLDARAVNGHWWVFFGALTNVDFDLRVRDLATGRARLYHNPSGRFASRGDTAAFAADGSAAPAAAGPAPAWFLMLPDADGDLAGACADGGTSLCLLERFRVSVDWQDPTGNGGAGHARPLTSETGWFWFFDADNPELFVKVLDGRAVNGHWWVFFGSLTDVRFDLVVEDAVGGGRAAYHHPAGTFASRGDTTAIR